MKRKILMGAVLIFGGYAATFCADADVYQQFFARFSIHNYFYSMFKPLDLPQEVKRLDGREREKKPWTFIVYMSADNDLRSFAINNVSQMASIGSNEQVNVVCHLDVRLNNTKVTKRFYVEKDRLITDEELAGQKMDSGDPATLVSCCEWAVNNYPADNYALVLWNHATGILDPYKYKVIDPSALFEFNHATLKFDLDRSVSFLEIFNYLDDRGICFDMTSGNYLTNQKLVRALSEIHTRVLKNKKFAMIGFDACLMSMLEVASQVKEYAEIMVGAQEVELASGWHYGKVLKPFTKGEVTSCDLARNIVRSFRNVYEKITDDYTQSSVDLSLVSGLEQNVHEVATILLECIEHQKDGSVIKAITACKKQSTHFLESSYIDLHHFYYNLSQQLSEFKLNAHQDAVQRLSQKVGAGKQLIQAAVFSNMAGNKLDNAQGLSIYFPNREIHQSYPLAPFAQHNAWLPFIARYLNG